MGAVKAIRAAREDASLAIEAFGSLTWIQLQSGGEPDAQFAGLVRATQSPDTMHLSCVGFELNFIPDSIH
jgi:hypothetical protein